MLTTHVGSLPFTNVDEAIEFTFRFDIPVLFTLPNLNANEFIHREVVEKLCIGKVVGQKIILDSNSETKDFYSEYEEIFFSTLQSKKIRRFKFQLIGPVTLYHLSDKKIDLTTITALLLEHYLKLLDRYRDLADVLFILDEPMLNISFSNDIYYLNKFLSELNRFVNVDIGLHICSKLPVDDLNAIKTKYINFDTSLYTHEELKFIKNKYFLGFKASQLDSFVTASKRSESLENTEIISPSCGLVFENIKEIDRYSKYLTELSKKGVV